LTLDKTELRTRTATIADTVAIVEIYNQRIADRIATFEIEPRTAADIAEWFARQHLVMVAETRETGPIAFATSFPYSKHSDRILHRLLAIEKQLRLVEQPKAPRISRRQLLE
jgi:hypothetical protein